MLVLQSVNPNTAHQRSDRDLKSNPTLIQVCKEKEREKEYTVGYEIVGLLQLNKFVVSFVLELNVLSDVEHSVCSQIMEGNM